MRLPAYHKTNIESNESKPLKRKAKDFESEQTQSPKSNRKRVSFGPSQTINYPVPTIEKIKDHQFETELQKCEEELFYYQNEDKTFLDQVKKNNSELGNMLSQLKTQMGIPITRTENELQTLYDLLSEEQQLADDMEKENQNYYTKITLAINELEENLRNVSNENNTEKKHEILSRVMTKQKHQQYKFIMNMFKYSGITVQRTTESYKISYKKNNYSLTSMPSSFVIMVTHDPLNLFQPGVHKIPAIQLKYLTYRLLGEK
ncbi:hypothetical protein SteCoe_25443 [Stentor coeruleus]|uniref:Uncharacterized protein n=1 Tax=Stentor coeruleus TaxID=5963 RepID=A0A1R2BFA3_9CILI|nr:hypothetical protein SteCoe_25443 [Stentor coeruleus]